MSFPADCLSCVAGKHEGHNSKEGTRPGLIGGTVCNCTGDCAERAAAAWESIFADISRTYAYGNEPTLKITNKVEDVIQWRFKDDKENTWRDDVILTENTLRLSKMTAKQYFVEYKKMLAETREDIVVRLIERRIRTEIIEEVIR